MTPLQSFVLVFKEKNARTRSETVLHIVLKFQVDRACLQGGYYAVTNFGRKWNKKKKERKRDRHNNIDDMTLSAGHY